MSEWAKLDYSQAEWKISKFMNYPTFLCPFPLFSKGEKGNKAQLKVGHYLLESHGKVILVALEVIPILFQVFFKEECILFF